MIDYRKMLVAQIVACIDFDGGAPSIDDLGGWVSPFSEEELDAYDGIYAEAQAIVTAARRRDVFGDEIIPATSRKGLLSQ